MDFGRLPEDELDTVDFSLPAEPADNKKVLGGMRKANAGVYIGCTRWGGKEWIGKIYPKGTRDAQFLELYVQYYNTVELNATHYQIYGPEVIAKWAAKAAGYDFKFCPKVPQIISHYSNFANTDAMTTSFLEGVLAFGDNLGPIFLQVSDKYAPNRKETLFKYLESLPRDLQFFLEVRHQDWFGDAGIRKELFDTLRTLKIGAVITDTAGRRDCAHMELTVPKTFIRFVGNSLHKTDHTRLDTWVARMKYWLDNGIEELYLFMHARDETYAPELTIYLVDKLNDACGLQLPRPTFIQPELPNGGQMSFF